MKKLLTIFFAFICLASTASAEETRDMALKVGVPGSIMFESAISEKLSLGIEVAGSRFYPESASYDWVNGGGIVNARAIGARAVWQPKGVFNKGAYLAGWVDYLSFDYDTFGYNPNYNNNTSSTSIGSGSTVAVGIMIGYQYLYDRDLILNFGAGYGFMKGTNINTTTNTTTYDAIGNILSTSSSPSTSNIKTSDVFIFDAYIGYLF